MLAAIAQALGSAISTSPLNAADPSDLFEAYVLTLVIRAARMEQATVSYSSRNGSAATELVLRTAPGFISSAVKNYTHAVLAFPNGSTLEAHVGIKVAGRSGVLHELDVAVLERAEAENCRRNGIAPRSFKVVIGIECKFYSSALQLYLARGFVGLVADLSVRSPFFVTNTNSASVEKLLSHRVRHGWEKDIFPGCRNAEVDRLVNAFRNCFKNYQAQAR